MPAKLHPSHHEQHGNYPDERSQHVYSPRFGEWLAAEYTEHWRRLGMKDVGPKK